MYRGWLDVRFNKTGKVGGSDVMNSFKSHARHFRLDLGGSREPLE